MERQVFNRQPGNQYYMFKGSNHSFYTARALILDLQAPMSPATCSNIHAALRDVLSIIVHLLGPGRVPLFSLSVLRTYTEVIIIIIIIIYY